MSLKEPLLKMSKSHVDPRSRILLNDSSETIQMKIRAALTDSVEGISYSPTNRPGVSNLLTLRACMDENAISEEQIAMESQALSMRAFKDEVATTIIKGVRDIKVKYDYYIHPTRKQYLLDVAALGNHKARLMAEETMAQVRDMVGTGPL
ncbi:MAG: hypothetical protein LQ343_006040 [Gyalolechia ehrenbergii]|nr:MAG: hypothetical protein LQ343_006040 [Gyalolechia ehrenbergii]